MEVELFARALLAGQPAFPRYFARMRPLNQAGPPPLGGVVPEIVPLADAALDAVLDGGALIVDARPPDAYAVAHAPGSLSIPAGESFGTWLGWLVEPDRPVVLIVEHQADLDDLSRQALRIGYEATAGHVAGGFDAWRRAGRPVEPGAALDVDALARSLSAGGPEAPFVIDVRQLGEYERGHVPGALHIMAADLPSTLERLPADRPIATICASGFRSSIAASLLRSAGFGRVAAVAGGVPDWEAHGYPLDYGAGTDGLDWPAPTDDAAVHEAHAH
jgi:hydroxyacylglutathione hydrolase